MFSVCYVPFEVRYMCYLVSLLCVMCVFFLLAHLVCSVSFNNAHRVTSYSVSTM